MSIFSSGNGLLKNWRMVRKPGLFPVNTRVPSRIALCVNLGKKMHSQSLDIGIKLTPLFIFISAVIASVHLMVIHASGNF